VDRYLGVARDNHEAPLALLEHRGATLWAPWRDVPGACLWIRSETFHRIGGFDERFRGWGGEDDDMLVRLTSAASVHQYDDALLHLAHRRPPMSREDGRPFNADIAIGTWTGAAGYGGWTAAAPHPGRG
jgi:hypothetical protein